MIGNEGQQKQEFKKQALEFILSIYLQRQNDEDIKFIQENVKDTNEFAKNISSDLKHGLDKDNVEKNKNIYGRNMKRATKTFKFEDVLKRVLKVNNFLIFFICTVQIIFGTLTQNRQIYMDAVYATVLLIFFLSIRIVTIYLNQKKKSDESYDKNKNQKYCVFRQGSIVQVPQTKIVVGDIIELNYKEKVPASGLIITNKQIAMNEEIYGRKAQRKMSLEKCLAYISKRSVFELKIDSQKQTLPSPIILRGTEQIFGMSYKILVIAVDQEDLLEKFIVPQDSTFVSNTIRNWFQNLELKIGKIMRIISVLYLISFITLFGLKEFLQRKHLSVQNFMTDLFSVLLMSILSFSVFDTKCLRLFIETQVTSYTENLNNPKQVDKYLTVEQIYIAENNIVKYDEIVICQIGLPDKQNLVNYEDLGMLPDKTKSKIQEVLQGVGLKVNAKIAQKEEINMIKEDRSVVDPQHSLNQIIHVNTVDQKIFTTFYNYGNLQDFMENDSNSKEIKLKKKQKSKQASTVFGIGSEQNSSNISLNRVSPLDDDNPFKKKNNILFKRKPQNISRFSEVTNVQNEQTLKGYLGEFCGYQTKNIVESIVQLAKQQCRTFYYQKYSISRLRKIDSVWVNGSECEMTRQRSQKIKRIVKNIRITQNLTPFLIGYSHGAYNNQCMRVLVSVIGIRINYQNKIIKLMKQLSSMGIKSTVVIQKRDQSQVDISRRDAGVANSKITNQLNDQNDTGKVLAAEYISRGWITHQMEEIGDFRVLKQLGGMIRCENCFLSKCDCKNRIQQLSDIQSFMSHSENTKLIHSISSPQDFHYLKVASQQTRNSVLTITKYKSDTIKILNDIKRGYYLSNILERGLHVWYGFMFVSAVCFYPLSLVSFGGVFASGDISLWILFIQSLPAIGNMRIQIQQKEKVENNSRRNKVLYSHKSTISVFLLCLISTIMAVLFYIKPQDIIQESFTSVAAQIQASSGMIFERDCQFKFSIFLSDNFNKLQCVPPAVDPTTHQPKIYNTSAVPQYIYSQNVNFIFAYLCLNILLFFMINFKNFSKPTVLAVYISMFGVYFIVIYVLPDIIHGRYDGLTGPQLAIVFGMSIATILVIQCIGYLSNYKCGGCATEEFQSILSYQENIEEHYSTKLKKYNTFQTINYTLN